MRNILFLLLLASLSFGCKKNSDQTSNPPDDQTNSQWTLILYNPNIWEFKSVCFTDNNTGYAVGYNITWEHYPMPMSTQVIMKTYNGGNSWTALTLPNPTPNTLNSVYFLNALTGFVAGSDILKTSDGGSTWMVLTTDISCNINSLFFTDNNTGYAVGSSSTQQGVNSGVILKTIDSGSSWHILTFSSTTVSNLNSVNFTDANTGYAVGDVEHLVNGDGIILKTKDGGNTWQNFTLPETTATILSSVFFVDDNTGFSAGRLLYANPDLAPEGVILKTADHGTTWAKLTLPDTKAEDLKSVHFSDINTGFVAGSFYKNGNFYGVIYKTINGGITWYPLTLPSKDTYGLNSVFFTNGDTGYAVGEMGTILKTTSGGE